MPLIPMQAAALAVLMCAHCCCVVSPSWLEAGARPTSNLASLIDEEDPNVPDSIRILARSPSIASAVRNAHLTPKRLVVSVPYIVYVP